MVREHEKYKIVSVPYSMSIPTGLALLVTAFIYSTIGLRLSAVATAVVGVIWLATAAQKSMYGEAIKIYLNVGNKAGEEVNFYEPGDSNIKVFGPFNLDPDTTGSIKVDDCTPSSSSTRCEECRNTNCDKHLEFNSGGMYG